MHPGILQHEITAEISLIYVSEPTIYDAALPDLMARHMREADKCHDEGQTTESAATLERTRIHDLRQEIRVAREKTGPEDATHHAEESVTADSTQEEPRELRASQENPARRSPTSRRHNSRTRRQALRLNEILHASRAYTNQTQVSTCLGSTTSLSRSPFPPEREEIEADHDLVLLPEVTQLTPVMIETPIRNMIRLPSLRGRRRCGSRLLSRNVPTFLVPHSPNSISVW